jgi:hypothetical protein
VSVTDADEAPVTIDDLDPMDCPACLDRRSICDFHAGVVAGWDLLAGYVAREVQ